MEHRRRADHRMAREIELLVEIEDPGSERPFAAVAFEEDRFEVAQLLGDPVHLRSREARRVGKHGEAVAAVGTGREDVDVMKTDWLGHWNPPGREDDRADPAAR